MAKKERDDDQPVIIKKYANRRLYNTEKSSYVTLEDLAEMVRDGVDFVVTDAKSGEDITRSVLTQIIFEEEAKGQTMLPAKFLRQLISLYGDSLQGFVPSYLEASMETFQSNQEKLRDQMKLALGGNPAMANFEALARTNMDWFENAMRVFTPFVPGVKVPKGGAENPAEDSSARPATKDVELGDLKSQLAEMQQQLAKLMKDG